MARATLKNKTASKVVDQVLDEEAEVEEAELDETPSYVMIGDASIPVSKKAGTNWKSKIDDALAATETDRAFWDQAYVDYRRVGHSDSVSVTDTRLVAGNDTDENLVRENVKTLLRTTYTRNPKIEFSAFNNEKQE